MARAEAKAGRELRRHAKMELMFDDAEIDVVLLVLPIPLMPAAIEAALRAGKHVLSEKPAAPSIEAAHGLLSMMRSLPQPTPAWLVLENWAHKPSVKWLRDRLQEGAIGRIMGAQCAHAEHVPARGGLAGGWRAEGQFEGGWLLDIGVHWARALRTLLGEPGACSASVAQLHAHLPPADSLDGWMRFEHCAVAATLSLSIGERRSAGDEPSLRLHGERGTLSWWVRDPSNGGAGGFARVKLQPVGEAAEEVSLPDDFVTGGVEPALAEALRHVQTLRGARRASKSGGGPSSCLLGCDEGLRDVAMISALLSSGAEGKVVQAPTLLSPASPIVQMPPTPLWDASGTRHFAPALRVPCATEAEVRAALELAALKRLHARPIGSAHSWSGYGAAGEGVCLELRTMGRVLSVSAASRRVVVEPGLTLRELRRVLAANNLTMGSWPMLLDQTVGGATVGSGSHGSSSSDGTLADAVVALRLVTADGTKVHTMTLIDFRERASALLGLYRHLWAIWALGDDELCACCLEDVGSAPAHGATRYDGENWYRGSPTFEAPGSRGRRRAQLQRHPSPVPDSAVASAGSPQERGAQPAASGADAAEESSTRWFSLQFAVPLESLGSLLRRLSQLAVEAPGFSGREVELKFVGASGGRTLLGVNAEGAVVCANVHWRLKSTERHLLETLGEVLQQMGGRPHLGKIHRLPSIASWAGLGRFAAAGGSRLLTDGQTLS